MKITGSAKAACMYALMMPASASLGEEAGRYLSESEMGASIEKVRREFALRDAVHKERKSQWKARVALPYPENECIAFLRNNGVCLLTAGEFNLSLNPDDSISLLDSASDKSKAELLGVRKSLLDRFVTTMHGRAMLQDTNDARIRRELDSAWRAALAEEEKSAGKAKLDGLYRIYYDAYFAPRRRLEMEIMGSSDSLFLDSLIGSLTNPMVHFPKGAGQPEKNGAKDMGRVFLWETADLDDLPAEISESLQELRPGGFSPLIRASYGWFAARAIKSAPASAVSRADALPMLLSLASIRQEFFHSLENAPEDHSTAFGPPEQTSDPYIRCWLTPPSRIPGRSFSMPKWADTTRVKAMEFRFSLLPDPVRREFSGILSRYGYGIRKTSLGVWYLKILPYRPDPDQPHDPTRQRMLETRRETAKLRGVYQAAAEDAVGREREFKLAFLLSRKTAETRLNAFTGMESKWLEANVDLDEGLLRP